MQRIDVLNECREELIRSFKRSVWLLLALLTILGVLGLDTLLRKRVSEDGIQALLAKSLQKNVDFAKLVAAELAPLQARRITSKFTVNPSEKTSSITLPCPDGLYPVSGGFNNPKSAVNLVQIAAEEAQLTLSLDKDGAEPFEVKAWAVCISVDTRLFEAGSKG